MIKKAVFLVILSGAIWKTGFSQAVGHADSLSRQRAEAIVTTQLTISAMENYLLFSIADKLYLIIVEKHGRFYEYYINADTSRYRPKITKTLKVIQKNAILSKAFDEKSYRKDYITFSSPFFNGQYEQADGNETYFYLKKQGVKYGEARLTVIVKPNPINQEVYYYLVTKLIKFISK